jgi:hypothetical protein
MRTYDQGCDTALARLGFHKTAGPITTAFREGASDYVDVTTGQAPDPHQVVLKQLGLADYPEIISLEQFERLQTPPLGTAVNPPAPIKTSAFKFGTTGLMMDEPPRESPEWTPPPSPQHHRHHQLLADPGFQESEVPQGNVYTDTENKKQDEQPIPGDNEAPGGVSGGAGPQMSGGGAEVMVPDQTPQRQAMTLYDTPSSDVGGIFNHFDQRLQNPATNSIIRFVSE